MRGDRYFPSKIFITFSMVSLAMLQFGRSLRTWAVRSAEYADEMSFMNKKVQIAIVSSKHIVHCKQEFSKIMSKFKFRGYRMSLMYIEVPLSKMGSFFIKVLENISSVNEP